MTSHVQNLGAELEKLAQGYIAMQEKITAVSMQADELQTTWTNLGLTSKTPGFDSANQFVGEFHRMLGSLPAWAFSLGAEIGGLKAHL
jgi:hypothetical protein